MSMLEPLLGGNAISGLELKCNMYYDVRWVPRGFSSARQTTWDRA